MLYLQPSDILYGVSSRQLVCGAQDTSPSEFPLLLPHDWQDRALKLDALSCEEIGDTLPQWAESGYTFGAYWFYECAYATGTNVLVLTIPPPKCIRSLEHLYNFMAGLSLITWFTEKYAKGESQGAIALGFYSFGLWTMASQKAIMKLFPVTILALKRVRYLLPNLKNIGLFWKFPNSSYQRKKLYYLYVLYVHAIPSWHLYIKISSIELLPPIYFYCWHVGHHNGVIIAAGELIF